MGVKGRLKDMSLVDIIQIFATERKTVGIHVGSEMGYGCVYLKNGYIIHATYREFTGPSALFQLLAWKDGEFEVEIDAVTDERTIDKPAEAIILEGLRLLDESRAKGGEKGVYAGDMESIRLINKLLDLGVLEKN